MESLTQEIEDLDLSEIEDLEPDDDEPGDIDDLDQLPQGVAVNEPEPVVDIDKEITKARGELENIDKQIHELLEIRNAPGANGTHRMGANFKVRDLETARGPIKQRLDDLLGTNAADLVSEMAEGAAAEITRLESEADALDGRLGDLESRLNKSEHQIAENSARLQQGIARDNVDAIRTAQAELEVHQARRSAALVAVENLSGERAEIERKIAAAKAAITLQGELADYAKAVDRVQGIQAARRSIRLLAREVEDASEKFATDALDNLRDQERHITQLADIAGVSPAGGLLARIQRAAQLDGAAGKQRLIDTLKNEFGITAAPCTSLLFERIAGNSNK